MADDHLRIGDLAEATGTKVETIRYYERVGLLPAPGRTPGNYRAYGPTHLEPAELHPAGARPRVLAGAGARAARASRRPRPARARRWTRSPGEHLAEVERKIADLTALRRELAELIGRCRRGTVAECRIVEALSPGT